MKKQRLGFLMILILVGYQQLYASGKRLREDRQSFADKDEFEKNIECLGKIVNARDLSLKEEDLLHKYSQIKQQKHLSIQAPDEMVNSLYQCPSIKRCGECKE